VDDDPPPPRAESLLVRTMRGIEPITAAEIRQRLPVRAVELGHREVRFRLALTREVLGLGTADDAFLVLLDGPPIGPHRPNLALLRSAVRELDLGEVTRRLARVRVATRRTFDVTGSFLGRRNYSATTSRTPSGRRSKHWATGATRAAGRGRFPAPSCLSEPI
jgi:hypothetical protein